MGLLARVLLLAALLAGVGATDSDQKALPQKPALSEGQLLDSEWRRRRRPIGGAPGAAAPTDLPPPRAGQGLLALKAAISNFGSSKARSWKQSGAARRAGAKHALCMCPPARPGPPGSPVYQHAPRAASYLTHRLVQVRPANPSLGRTCAAWQGGWPACKRGGGGAQCGAAVLLNWHCEPAAIALQHQCRHAHSCAGRQC